MDRATETDRLQLGRLERVREQLKARDLGARVLLDPVNIRRQDFRPGMRAQELRSSRRAGGERSPVSA